MCNGNIGQVALEQAVGVGVFGVGPAPAMMDHLGNAVEKGIGAGMGLGGAVGETRERRFGLWDRPLGVGTS
jgi:hypothetical protein